jgi:predicted O-methyltransferase YrrM
MQIALPSAEELNQLEITDLFPYVLHSDSRKYFDLPAGTEHYRLLAYLSLHFNKHVLLDVGTHMGMSALALAYNRTCKVITVDLVDKLLGPALSAKNRSNIEFRVENVLHNLSSYLDKCPFIMLDTNHDGEFEAQLYAALIKINYRGLLLLDDIALSAEMKSFWNSIHHKKLDLTHLGHWSGTGAVVFDSGFIDLI